MPNGLNNWSYKDVSKFLKRNGFVFYRELKGSHEAWVKKAQKDEGSKDYVVNVHKEKSSFGLNTIKTMIRSSGISEKVWREWKG